MRWSGQEVVFPIIALAWPAVKQGRSSLRVPCGVRECLKPRLFFLILSEVPLDYHADTHLVLASERESGPDCGDGEELTVWSEWGIEGGWEKQQRRILSSVFGGGGVPSSVMNAAENGSGPAATDSHPAAKTALIAESGYFLTLTAPMKLCRWTLAET